MWPNNGHARGHVGPCSVTGRAQLCTSSDKNASPFDSLDLLLVCHSFELFLQFFIAYALVLIAIRFVAVLVAAGLQARKPSRFAGCVAHCPGRAWLLIVQNVGCPRGIPQAICTTRVVVCYTRCGTSRLQANTHFYDDRYADTADR
jgi:hypothetical protein